MKELSIEEKAQRYDEALKEAVIAHKDEDRHLKATLERIFPELKESEDMIMVKFIKNQLFNIKKTITENYELDAKLTKAIDWLEKQGNLMKALQISNARIGELIEKNYYLKEQFEKKGNNMGISEATKQKLEDSLNEALEKETPESWNKFLDERGEQKPVDKIESRQKELTEFEKAVKQVMEESIECGDTHNLKADADMLLRLVQKPWGEEDEHGFENCLYAIKETFKGVDNPHRVGTINWLKSLKERYTWKPSDEQMKGIECTIKTLKYQLNVGDNRLDSLYNDLKKLREE